MSGHFEWNKSNEKQKFKKSHENINSLESNHSSKSTLKTNYLSEKIKKDQFHNIAKGNSRLPIIKKIHWRKNFFWLITETTLPGNCKFWHGTTSIMFNII